jgi:hypothetical protein
MGPRCHRLAGGVDQPHRRVAALLAQLVGGVDGKEHGIVPALIGPVFVAVTGDDPPIALGPYQVFRALRRRNRSDIVIAGRSHRHSLVDNDAVNGERSPMVSSRM